jgi:spermidine synthase
VPALLASILAIAAAGLAYELLIATIASYLLGNSVTQFSLAIGVFIGAMGLGSYLSQGVRRGLLGVFLTVEVALGLIGGASACLLFAAYARGLVYWPVLYGLLVTIGGLTGLELPLLTRLLRRYGALRSVIARALSFDYLGALLGSLAFPLLLLPTLGMTRTAAALGLVNVSVAAYTAGVFRDRLRRPSAFLALCGAAGAALVAAFLFAGPLVSALERDLYEDEIIYTRQTPYQRIVVTRWRDDLRLFLDGNLQFSSTDEYRYHEALVHPAMGLAASVEEILVLGGGDGLGVREVLKHPGVRRVTLVDIDPAMTRLARAFPALLALNGRALLDPRVRIVHEDASRFLERETTRYGVILADLPDPNSETLARLYSREFYRLAARHLARGGLFVTQATSPYFGRDAFWCVVATMRAAGLSTLPYHAYVPTFGDWGFVLASPHRNGFPRRRRFRAEEGLLAGVGGPNPRLEKARLDVPTRFLTRQVLAEMTAFPKDSAEVAVRPSTLDQPTVMTYYRRSGKRWE